MDAVGQPWPPRVEAASVGTRFLVFPQSPHVPGYERPEVIWLPLRPGEVRAGPSSRRAYVLDPILSKEPYEAPYLPPFSGLCHPPAEPGPDGHFDHLEPGTRAFAAAHAFACVHRMLDICENYAGRSLPWFFGPTYERLEIIPRLAWGNAQSGYGFLELGEDDSREETFPFALNFDVIAHELAHLAIFCGLGVPWRTSPGDDYLTYHEAVADTISLIGLLHFDTALDRILRRTRGNLLVLNELDRFGELTDETQVRRFSNSLRMRDVGAEVHDRSKPFAGALFDTLIEIYQVLLVERGLADIDPRNYDHIRAEWPEAELDRALKTGRQDYELRHYPTKAALADARDILGEILIGSWRFLDPDDFSLGAAKEGLLTAALRGRGAPYADRIEENFVWRGFARSPMA